MTADNSSRPDKYGLALLVIAAAQLLMVMDATIVTVGLPVIGAGLGIAETDLDWVLTVARAAAKIVCCTRLSPGDGAAKSLS